MNDKELLELAAKAAGIEVRKVFANTLHVVGRNGATVNWNPLIDDGNALRLAVKLSMQSETGITIHLCDRDDKTTVVRDYGDVYICEEIDNDPYAATRRAIVRAAAEIGKGMK